VLEVGAGPGRFTIELAAIGARVTVADLSEVQLALNVDRVSEAGAEASVERRVVADIVDLRQFADAAFDCVVCHGGPLSYVLEQADAAAGLDEELKDAVVRWQVMLAAEPGAIDSGAHIIAVVEKAPDTDG
jgi:SAM-dependent methyltransferase